MIELNNILYVSVISFLLSYLILYVFKKKNILIDKVFYSKHKQLINASLKSPPLCGGIIIFICSIFFFKDLFLLNIFGMLILAIGIFSDSNKISSPFIRILFQLIVILSFTILTDLRIIDLKVDIINNLLDIKFISILFTVFCILILVNGSNFIDGLNTLVIGYYILVSFFLISLSSTFGLIINPNINLLLIFLLVLFLFNFLGKIFLGDSGAYLIAFYISFFVIDFSLKNSLVSPYLICFLLWYPAFENLFSILRRIILKQKTHNADQHHLHQVLYNYFVKLKLIDSRYINILTAILINTFNFITFAYFYKFYSNTKLLILGLLMNISIYLILYFFIKKKLSF